MKGSAVHYMKDSEVKLTTLNVVRPVASMSLLIGSDVHHFVFTVGQPACSTTDKPA